MHSFSPKASFRARKIEKALSSLQIQLAVGIAFGPGESKLRRMNAFIVVVATLAALLACTFAVAATSAESVSSLQAKMADAKRDVSRAQTNFDRAKEKACTGLSGADKAQWQQAETKFESALAGGSNDQIAARKGAVEGLNPARRRTPTARTRCRPRRADRRPRKTQRRQSEARRRHARHEQSRRKLPGDPARKPHPKRRQFLHPLTTGLRESSALARVTVSGSEGLRSVKSEGAPNPKRHC